jgi:tetratricopeptide (TPR) repeat protein
MILIKVTASNMLKMFPTQRLMIFGLAVFSTFVVLNSFQLHIYASAAEASGPEIKWYEKALLVNPNNLPALVEKGTNLVASGNPERALIWLDKALIINPDSMMALISKGAALSDLGEYEKAITSYDKVLAIDPHDVYAIGGKAESLYLSHQPQQAIAWIDKALELNPADGKVQLVKESIQQALE